jgi:hypothetical protein
MAGVQAGAACSAITEGGYPHTPALQSPELIRAREALQRTSKRIKAGEKEVSD